MPMPIPDEIYEDSRASVVRTKNQFSSLCGYRAGDIRKELYEIILSRLVIASFYYRSDVYEDVEKTLKAGNFPFYVPPVGERNLSELAGTLVLPTVRTFFSPPEEDAIPAYLTTEQAEALLDDFADFYAVLISLLIDASRHSLSYDNMHVIRFLDDRSFKLHEHGQLHIGTIVDRLNIPLSRFEDGQGPAQQTTP